MGALGFFCTNICKTLLWPDKQFLWQARRKFRKKRLFCAFQQEKKKKKMQSPWENYVATRSGCGRRGYLQADWENFLRYNFWFFVFIFHINLLLEWFYFDLISVTRQECIREVRNFALDFRDWANPFDSKIRFSMSYAASINSVCIGYGDGVIVAAPSKGNVFCVTISWWQWTFEGQWVRWFWIISGFPVFGHTVTIVLTIKRI